MLENCLQKLPYPIGHIVHSKPDHNPMFTLLYSLTLELTLSGQHYHVHKICTVLSFAHLCVYLLEFWKIIWTRTYKKNIVQGQGSEFQNCLTDFYVFLNVVTTSMNKDSRRDVLVL